MVTLGIIDTDIGLQRERGRIVIVYFIMQSSLQVLLTNKILRKTQICNYMT